MSGHLGLYQPPPGTVIVVVARPAGVKLHVPERSTEAIAALPADTPSRPAARTAASVVSAEAGHSATAACWHKTAATSAAAGTETRSRRSRLEGRP
jgi:hypothetical protein